MGDQTLLSRRQAAARCGVSVTSFERHILRRIDRALVGRRVLFYADSVTKYLESLRIAPETEEKRAPARPRSPERQLTPAASAILAQMKNRKKKA